MKIAIVQEWLTNLGGSERVVFDISEIFTKAPIYTSVANLKNLPEEYKELDIRTSFLQKIPFFSKRHQLLLPLMPLAFESFDLSDYDVVISSSHSCAKGIITKPETLHISYCHTPTRYLWSNYSEYKKESQFNYLINKTIPRLTNKLRIWDRLAAERVDRFVCNSHYVSERVKKYYKREATVIYPPVDTSFFKPSDKIGDYYLIVSRLIPYKKVDLVIQSFNDLKIPLKIIGKGPEYDKLKKMANSNIEFLGSLTDGEVKEYYSHALAFIAPQEEDFGITPVEAMASGRPVIAYNKGGLKETVVEGLTGTFFNEQTPQCLIDVIQKFNPKKYNQNLIRQHALKFDTVVFKRRFKKFVEDSYLEYLKNINLHI